MKIYVSATRVSRETGRGGHWSNGIFSMGLFCRSDDLCVLDVTIPHYTHHPAIGVFIIVTYLVVRRMLSSSLKVWR